MFYTYLFLSCSINRVEEMQNSLYSLEEIFSCTESMISAVANLLIALVGVCGIKYLSKIKEKNYNATFSYYIRLKVRLHIIKTVLSEHKKPFLDRLIPESERTDIEPSKKATVDYAIRDLIDNSKETLTFLKDTEDQMPASREWSSHYSTLLEFLVDCAKMENLNYYKWSGDCANELESYYTRHQNNITSMLKDISEQQEKIQKKLYKRSLFCKLKTAFSKKRNKKKKIIKKSCNIGLR